ncbi:ABC transporter ATP-binding protein [Nocardia arthritidis]|uniref:ATP-binding cassette domain-containing protein n=1 Tax=Nocardia arthritidis TaxID=228602 RepID=A0A6G9YLD3_9NOCA|nr:ABC transporter ATP-binding protein [Nocardia arthritidis]QIS14079.1 ATP-binding cassette domain-containing protein [Nocardia arthritidis]
MTNVRDDPNRALRTDGLTLAYDGREVVRELNAALPDGGFTAIIGPNGCGKSTLLRGLARLLMPRRGAAYLDGQPIHRLPTRTVARRIGLLPQSPIAPEAITVEDLVWRGRYPHRRLLRAADTADRAAVEAALTSTGLLELRGRPVDELSGGQRQRAWIALALAQQTPLLLLDEPTTYLDLRHQLDVLDLLAHLHRDAGRTVVAVLHDLDQACRYATHLVVLADGRLVAAGEPARIMTAELVEQVFDVPCEIIPDPFTGTPMVVPRPRGARGKE